MAEECERCGAAVPADESRMVVRVKVTGRDGAETLDGFVLCAECAAYAEDRLTLETGRESPRR